jgi:hypothetical protein
MNRKVHCEALVSGALFVRNDRGNGCGEVRQMSLDIPGRT